MKFAAAVSALATMASAAAVAKQASPLDVKIEMVGNSGVKATVTNTGSEDLKIFKTGSILDKTPTEKVKITQGKSRVAFNGVRLRVMKSGLQESSFQVIPAGKTIEHTFDAAELHDLSAGGAVSMVSKGALQYAKAGSTQIIGSVPYSSNLLSATVDGVAASKIFKAYHAKAKRQAVQDDCSSSQASATSEAINTCAELAAEAASVAESDDDKLAEYFKNADSSTRSTVVSVFNAAASECGSTSSGAPYYCSDVYDACEPGVIAYTLPSEEYMVNCPIFFSDLSPASSSCHDQDQWSTVLHETTHLLSVAGTDDYGGYGYDFVQSLSSEENLSHADTYALFAQSLYAGC
ncbi:neutral protease [Xylaria bambusicola]|uniref:neutral protease n=1 Tax=Xylaria bambusicola TaxID=326684 RepID=UPI0020079067|nr:neutral protease [Xylaria bambusicola]KAI0513143.1 neutral protease [Xylaria bambusicola]